MKKRKFLYSMAAMLALFVIWTILICSVDVKQIGPQQSSVGFATFNNYFHDLIGVNMALYTITDWLSIVPILFVLIFALQGLLQRNWVHRVSE